MDDDFSEMFNHKAGQNTVVEDAPATFENEVEEPEVNTVEETTQEDEVLEVEGDESQQEEQNQQEAVKENTLEYWKKKAEASEKQRRDLQSYTDKRIADIEKRLSAPQQPVQQQAPKPAEKQMTPEEFNDLFLDNPFEAVQKFAEMKLGNATPDQSAIQMQIMEGVQRSLHDDYDDVMNQVKNAVAFNPQLLQEIQSSVNPAKKAYELGKNLQASLQIQKDPAKYEAELRAKWEAEQEQINPKRGGLRKVPSTSPTKPNTPVAKKSEAVEFSGMFGPKGR
jgi:hypothetical protein